MRDRLKILFLTHWYPTPSRPVGAVFVREHARAVALYDDAVVLHLAGPRSGLGLRDWWRLEHEPCPDLTQGIPTYRVWHHPAPLPGATSLLYIGAAVQAVKRIVANGYLPHAIHAHVYEAGVPAVLLGKSYGIPVVITEHSSDFPRRRLARLQVHKARYAFARAAQVLPVSRALQDGIEEYGAHARFTILPNVVDTDLFYPSALPRQFGAVQRILFVGSLIPVKGVPILLRSLALLRHSRSDWHLDLVGDGPHRAEYEALAADLGLTSSLTFHGSKAKPEVAAFMRLADLFVLPSLSETFSVVTAEALASGLPVVATRCGGPEEYVCGEVGVLVEPNSAEALRDALNSVLEDAGERPKDRIASYAAQRFSPGVVGAKLHEMYSSLYRERI